MQDIIIKILNQMVAEKSSDLFLTANLPPIIKNNGILKKITEKEFLIEDLTTTIYSLMNESQQNYFHKNKECNFAIQTNQGRFRLNILWQRGMPAAVIRRIETKIPSLSELNVPVLLKDLIMMQRGLILIVGSTGAGKSTTLASMINYRNYNHEGHIITIEDPIEFLHEHAKSIITQREVGIDTKSFEIALKNALRQSPDLILIGEIRTPETMNYAISFAETGHLCLATLHANNANEAIDRVIDFFPNEKREQLLIDLSLNLKAVIAQQLVRLSSGQGMIPAVEILINNPTISECIRKGELKDIKEYMSKDRSLGMQTFDQALFQLYQDGKISYEEALQHADSPNEIRLKVKLSKKNFNSNVDNIKLDDS